MAQEALVLSAARPSTRQHPTVLCNVNVREVRAAAPPKGFGLFACSSCSAYTDMFTEERREKTCNACKALSMDQEPLFAMQHSGNRRVASPSGFWGSRRHQGSVGLEPGRRLCALLWLRALRAFAAGGAPAPCRGRSRPPVLLCRCCSVRAASLLC